MSKREIFRSGGRYEMCEITYWPEGNEPDYLLAYGADGREFICGRGYGTWCELSNLDLINRLRHRDKMLAGTDQ